MLKLMLVDGNNLAIRAREASNGTMTAEVEGIGTADTGALLIFINTLSKYVRQIRPDLLVVCWDGGRSTYRTGIYEGYKGYRKERPEVEDEASFDVFFLAKSFLSLAGIRQVEKRGVEADDLISAYWGHYRLTHEVYILSSDKDLLQLAYGGTTQIRPGAKPEFWSERAVEDHFGCKPWHLAEVFALAGDKSDDVPGIYGVGYKTAVKLLERYGWSITALLNSDEPKVQGQREVVERNLRLVNLYEPPPGVTVEVAPDFEPTGKNDIAYPTLREWLKELGMNTVMTRLREDRLWT